MSQCCSVALKGSAEPGTHLHLGPFLKNSPSPSHSDLGKTDDGVRAGFLLLTLKNYNLTSTNTFIGEAVVPLSSLPCVDSSQVHVVANTCLTMTSPGLDIGKSKDCYYRSNSKFTIVKFPINIIRWVVFAQPKYPCFM